MIKKPTEENERIRSQTNHKHIVFIDENLPKTDLLNTLVVYVSDLWEGMPDSDLIEECAAYCPAIPKRLLITADKDFSSLDLSSKYRKYQALSVIDLNKLSRRLKHRCGVRNQGVSKSSIAVKRTCIKNAYQLWLQSASA